MEHLQDVRRNMELQQQQPGPQQQGQQQLVQPQAAVVHPQRAAAPRGDGQQPHVWIQELLDIEQRLDRAANRHGRHGAGAATGPAPSGNVGGRIGNPPSNIPPAVIPSLATLDERTDFERRQRERLAEIVEKEAELLRARIYKVKLQSFKLERDLRLPRSELTRDLPNPIDGRIGM